MGKHTKSKKIKENRPLRERISLSAVILITASIGITFASFIVGGYSLNVLYENKLRDTWAIMYLEMEQRAAALSESFKSFEYSATGYDVSSLSNFQKPDVVAKIGSANQLTVLVGALPENTTLQSFGLKSKSFSTKWNMLKLAGVDYLAKFSSDKEVAVLSNKAASKGEYLVLWEKDFSKWMSQAKRALDGTKVYAINRQGSLMFSNYSRINEANFFYRNLVQRFVKDPLASGQLEFTNQKGESTYGFFQEIPNSNLVFFAETPKSVALGAMKAIILRSLLFLVGVVMVALIILQFPLSHSVGPLKDLVRLTREIAAGNFNAKAKNKGFGELAVLTRSFEKMGEGLTKRDKAINKLIVEQREKVRLEAEMEVARSIQSNLLPSEKLPAKTGLDVESYYQPAEECAGDWYGYYYDESRNETILAIADVSGHGAGSSMFAAIIAANFNQVVSEKNIDLEKLFSLTHHSIKSLGKGKWHATMQTAKYMPNKGEIEFINAGHTFPCVHDADSERRKGKFVSMPSHLLGHDEVELNRKTIMVKSGTKILLSTDGILEAKNEEHTDYGKRRLSQLCAGSTTSSKQEISALVNDLDAYCGSVKKVDDICIIAARVA